jgi:hypothetical protein
MWLNRPRHIYLYREQPAMRRLALVAALLFVRMNNLPNHLLCEGQAEISASNAKIATIG